MTIIPAAITLTSFNCPHCKVLAQQFWWVARADDLPKGKHPNIWNSRDEVDRRIEKFKKEKPDQKLDEGLEGELHQLADGEVLIGKESDSKYDHAVDNVFFSKCYACNRVSVWIHNRLVHPASYDAPASNAETPGDVLLDYNEAAAIAGMSPRGAAALLRLAIQKLMPHLGEKGDNLNADIAALVAKGMDPRIQQSLDIVRVIGNNAVHPGQVDLNDDPKVVGTLFNLVNLIVDSMIAQPKHIEATFKNLPKNALDQIAKRDKDKS